MNTGKQKPDFDLAALQAGERAEFARFVDTYSGQVYRLALKMLQNPQDAEDILQETFIKAYKALPRFEGRSSLSTWLYRIATNESLMFLRKNRPQQDKGYDILADFFERGQTRTFNKTDGENLPVEN